MKAKHTPKRRQNGIGVYVQDELATSGVNRAVNRKYERITSGKKKYGYKKVINNDLSTAEKFEIIRKIKNNK